MNVLVLVEDYPSDNSQALMYVHVRNKYYQKHGIGVTVLNFRCKCDYEYDGINVISLNSYKENIDKYNENILLCHAANIKHHYLFLNKYEKYFKKIIFFFHGHEILKLNEIYPKKYKWQKSQTMKRVFRSLYDRFKLLLWRKKLPKLLNKSHLIFVSNWLYERFLYYVHINPIKLEGHVSIINNSVGHTFEVENYDYKAVKKYDFITIRGNGLDGSKYGVDIVYNLAKKYSDLKFLIIGHGKFFDYNKKLENIEFIDKNLKHSEMINFLNDSRCAILPTRQDTQGVMTCEVATFGIPTITSNISVCREIFDGFENVRLINNDNIDEFNLSKILSDLEKNLPYQKNNKYFQENTINLEIEIFK